MTESSTTSTAGQPQTIIAALRLHTQRMIETTQLSRTQFARRLAEALEAAPEEVTRIPNPSTANSADQYDRLLDSLIKRVGRWITGENLPPADVLDHWIESLDEPFRSDCRADITRMMGSYYAERRARGPAGDFQSAGSLYEDFGAISTDLAVLLRDHVIDEHDLPAIPETREHIAQMIGHLESMDRRLHEVEQGAGTEGRRLRVAK
ncbi:hypothetical protein [Arhodomonas sp. AD133]|uniref:hypothetical protein n=1 Tax=Arhodomonas sp. AD133 TaxID=3415009 RepID=UPI003EBA37DF